MRHRLDVAATVLVFLVVAADFGFSGAMRRGWRIDEANKIAETFYLRLVLEGDFRNPEWVHSITARTNPPIGKYVFGLAGLASGHEIPSSPENIWVDHPPFSLPPKGGETLFASLRPAIRWVSVLATAWTAAILFWLALQVGGPIAAVVAVALLAFHPIAATVATQGIFDALQAAFVATLALPLVALARPAKSRRRDVILAAALGLAGALAFQTRLNGVLPFAAAIAAVAIATRGRRRLTILVAAILVFGALSLAVNPYYWTSGWPPTRTGQAAVSQRLLPLRIASRVHWQWSDAVELAHHFEEARLRTLTERSAFFMGVLAAGIVGPILLGGMVLATVLGMRWRDDPVFGAIVLFGVINAVLVMLWIPLDWARYVDIAIGSSALVAGCGWGLVVRRMIAMRAPREGRT